MELIYIQTRVKGQGSHELAPGNGKIKIEILQIFMHLVRTYINVCVNNFRLDVQNLLEITIMNVRKPKS